MTKQVAQSLAINKQEALRLLDEMCVSFDLRHEHTFARSVDKLRALLSEDGEPSAANWRQAIRAAQNMPNRFLMPDDGLEHWIAKRATELRDAEKEKGNG